MPDDHPPLTAVMEALCEAWSRSYGVVDLAPVALRALDTDPVREWAKNVKCIRWPGLRVRCSGVNRTLVHSECLLAALANIAPPQPKPEPKPFMCGYCDERFTAEDIKNHETICRTSK